MTEEELREHNAQIMEEMGRENSAAAAVISAVLRSLSRMNTSIKLRNPHNQGRSVNYDLVTGETKFVKAAGQVNGLKTVTDDLMEVTG